MKHRFGANEGKALALLSLIRGLAGPALSSSLGVFFPYIAAELGYSTGQLSLSVSLASVAGALFLPIGGKLFGRLSQRGATALGILLLAPAVALLGSARSLFVWYLAAIPIGCGTVLLVSLMAPLWLRRLFPDEGGAALGYLMAGSGMVGAMVQPLLARSLSSFGWRRTYVGLGGFSCTLMLLALAWLPNAPPRASCAASAPAPRGTEGSPAARPADTRRDLLALFLFQGVITGFSMFRQHFSTLHRAAGFSEGTLAWALWLSLAAAALGAVVLGSLTRAFGAARSGVLALLLGGVSFLCFLRAVNAPLFLLAAALHGAASSAIGIVTPAMAREVFPEANYARCLSRIMIASPVCTLLFMQLFAFSFDRSGTYFLGLCVGLFSLLSALFVWVRAFPRAFSVPRRRRGA